MPIVFYFVGAAIVTALVGTTATVLYNKQVEAATEGLPTLVPPTGTIKPPADIQYYPGGEYSVPGGVQGVITASQIAAQQQLAGSMGNPPIGDPTKDYSALWIVGIGLAGIVLLNRK